MGSLSLCFGPVSKNNSNIAVGLWEGPGVPINDFKGTLIQDWIFFIAFANFVYCTRPAIFYIKEMEQWIGSGASAFILYIYEFPHIQQLEMNLLTRLL